MSVFISLSSFALRQLVDGACAAVGIKESGEAVTAFLAERFTDHSQRLTRALENANDNAWKALEIALAGDSLELGNNNLDLVWLTAHCQRRESWCILEC